MPPCHTPILDALDNRIRFEIIWFCLENSVKSLDRFGGVVCKIGELTLVRRDKS